MRDETDPTRKSAPAFDMSYSPNQELSVKLHAPLRAFVPAVVYLVLAVLAFGCVTHAYNHPSASALTRWIVQGDKYRLLPSQTLAPFLVVCGMAAILRATMRGVRITFDWLESREVVFGFPRAKRWGFSTIRRIVFDQSRISVELYDGRREVLARVADPKRLEDTLRSLAARRRIEVLER